MRYLLVDRVESIEPDRAAVGWKGVAMSEDYLEWHFPEQPVLPGVLVLESLVQLAGWLEAASSDFARWLLLDRVTSARWYGFTGPGDRLDLRVERVAPADGADPSRRAFRGEASVRGERRALVEFEAATTALDDLSDRERARRALRALRGEGPAAPGRSPRA